MRFRHVLVGAAILATDCSNEASASSGCRDQAPFIYAGTQTLVGGGLPASAQASAGVRVGQPYKLEESGPCGDAPIQFEAQLAPQCVLTGHVSSAHWDHGGSGDFLSANATFDGGQVCTLPAVGAIAVGYGYVEWASGHARVVVAGDAPGGYVTYTFDGVTPSQAASL